MPQKKTRYRTAHEKVILDLCKMLSTESPDDDIWPNSRYRKKKRSVLDTNIFPDVVNFSKCIAYEVHWAGSRKEKQFSRLPEGWRGVNVFIADIWETQEVYVFSLDGQFALITDDDWHTPNLV